MAVEKKCRVGILFLILFLWLGFSGGGSWGGVDSGPPSPVWVVPYFQTPDSMEFCGEPVPLQSADVRERFDREFTIVVYSHAQVYLWLKRMERYFPWLEKQLAAKGLPDDIKYLAVAESDLMASAVSPAGAAGPWQFMAATGCAYGLAQSGAVDERYDFEKAAGGAFRYLKNLHDIFGEWTLAAAAYNCGEKRIQDEVRKQKARSYYLLRLPNETERYIFRILAIKEVLGNPAKYGYQLPKGAGYKTVPVEKVALSLPGPITAVAAAEAAGITYRELKLLNPCLISDVIPGGEFTVKVPEGRGKEFEKRMAAWKAAYKPSVILHRVVRGETLSGIARKYNVSGQDICKWNRLKKENVRAGQVLKIHR